MLKDGDVNHNCRAQYECWLCNHCWMYWMELNITGGEQHTHFFSSRWGRGYLPTLPLCSYWHLPHPHGVPSRCEMEVHLVPHPKVGLISVAPPSLLLLRTPLSIWVNKKPLTKLHQTGERDGGTLCRGKYCWRVDWMTLEVFSIRGDAMKLTAVWTGGSAALQVHCAMLQEVEKSSIWEITARTVFSCLFASEEALILLIASRRDSIYCLLQTVF